MKAVLKITPGILVDIIKGFKPGETPRHFIVSENPLPEDAEVLGAVIGRHYVGLVVEAKAFEHIDETERIDPVQDTRGRTRSSGSSLAYNHPHTVPS